MLASATAVGARPIAMHPAMTFTGTELDLDRLAGCVFGMTAGDAEREYAEGLVGDLGGIPLWVPESKRTLYHAGLAHGANHLVTLVSQAMELLAASGAEDPAATLRPLLSAALDNALAQGDAALTGPIVRGDVKTVQAHLQDIAENAPATVPSYVAMAKATADRAVLDGRLLPIRAARIVSLLDEALVRVGEAGPIPAAGSGCPPAPERPSMTTGPLLAKSREELRDALDGRRATRRVGPHDGCAARRPRRADGAGPQGGRLRGPGRGVDLRQPDAVRAR